MRCVTTCHKAGYDQYGEKCRQGLKYWPAEAEFVWYCEGFDLPPTERVTAKRNEDLPRLEEFKAKHSRYRPPDWRYDVVRFSNKVYAVHDALYDHKGLGVWMDADIVATKPIPSEYIESLLPDGAYIALFQRDGMHSECGLWLVDCDHPQHKRFLDTLLALYEQGTYRQAHEWHDSVLMDSTIRAFQREHLIEVHNLSGQYKGDDHPMAKHDIAMYVDHLKGPDRKNLGFSPERRSA